MKNTPSTFPGARPIKEKVKTKREGVLGHRGGPESL